MLIKKTIKALPIIGSLFEVRRKDFTEAASEVFISVLFSTVPLWFGPVFITISFKNDPGFLQLMYASLSKGEFYIYSTSLLAPLIYFIHVESDGFKHFPCGRSLMSFSVLVFLFAGALFGLNRFVEYISQSSSGQQNPIILLDSDTLFVCSLIIYLTTLTVVLIAHTYKNYHLTGGANASRNDTHDFVDELEHWSQGDG